jgi:hypothetical protein
MINAEQLAAMDIAEIKANFFDLMDTIVTTYGDNQDETTEQQQATQQPEGESHAE